MPKLKRAATMFSATAAALALTFAFSGTASASGTTVYTAWSKPYANYAANACDLRFASYGDHFYLDDNLKDGAGCYGKWADSDDGAYGTLNNTSGAGSTIDYNYDFAEGEHLKFTVCVQDGGFEYEATCSGWVSATA